MSPGLNSPGFGSQKKVNRSQTLLPVTAAMINKAEYNVTEDVFTYEGVEIHQITFIGIVREVQEAATNISYKIDDMTGHHFNVKKWIDGDDKSEGYNRSECREDTYVRVIGNMKSFQEGKVRSILAFHMIPITDFNEITFHLLDVIHANLCPKRTDNCQADQTSQNYGISSAYGLSTNDAGLTGPHKTVFNYISSCIAEQGISVDELQKKNHNLNEQQLR